MIVFGLIEYDYDGVCLHSIFENKRSALKALLALKRARVEENLESHKMFGDEYFPDFYKETWTRVKLNVVPYDVLK